MPSTVGSSRMLPESGGARPGLSAAVRPSVYQQRRARRAVNFWAGWNPRTVSVYQAANVSGPTNGTGRLGFAYQEIKGHETACARASRVRVESTIQWPPGRPSFLSSEHKPTTMRNEAWSLWRMTCLGQTESAGLSAWSYWEVCCLAFSWLRRRSAAPSPLRTRMTAVRLLT